MEIGFIGLGRMGKSMVLRLLSKKHRVVANNRSPEPLKEVARAGAKPAYSVEELFRLLPKQASQPRIVWIMLPAGPVTEEYVNKVVPFLSAGDILVDGGNANYRDSARRAESLKARGIRFLDVGTSGGVVAAKLGYCLMVGGDEKAFRHVEPVFRSLAIKGGYGYMGSPGAGHYVKMVHNAIEYGMMQAIGEGFELLHKSPYSKELDFRKVANLWNQGSIVRSFLMEMMEKAFSSDARLDRLVGYVDDTGEGRWAIQEAIDRNVAFSVITASLYARFISRDRDKFWAKSLAAMRNEFGGHEVKKK
ncbi:decarboxylating 6-phosphogluconate dehydrogenase [Candidatus Woesearchaeota archaeon]|nr:decarboxylating 6-phosphogluconate dehydrogenase [Candidatus Woesearchaeota archaeon]